MFRRLKESGEPGEAGHESHAEKKNTTHTHNITEQAYTTEQPHYHLQNEKRTDMKWLCRNQHGAGTGTGVVWAGHVGCCLCKGTVPVNMLVNREVLLSAASSWKSSSFIWKPGYREREMVSALKHSDGTLGNVFCMQRRWRQQTSQISLQKLKQNQFITLGFYICSSDQW